MNVPVYSYHTFLYPFIWDDGGTVDREDFEKIIKENPHWKEDHMVTDQDQLSSLTEGEKKSWITPDDWRFDYQTFQYFNSAARKALFQGDGDIVHGYLYDPEDVHNKGRYIIHYLEKVKPDGMKIDKKEVIEEKQFTLNVNNVYLRLFNTGVGILVLETEYTLPEGGAVQARKDVLAINEYGRRLYPEFLPGEKQEKDEEQKSEKQNHKDDKSIYYGNICASKLELVLGEMHFAEKIMNRASAHVGVSGTEYLPEESYLRDPGQHDNFVKRLILGDSTRYAIVPAIDDRMFICCCIIDQAYSEYFMGYPAFPDEETEKKQILLRQSSSWAFRKDWEIGKTLYGLINIDKGDASCQNREMLDQYFQDQLYLRWIEYGTIHAVTNHSMMCITGSGGMVTVVIPFLIEYVQLCMLVLAQRASLISFDSRITNAIASSYDASDIQEVQLSQLIKLQKQFTIFQGQLMLAEVTSQIQGIEIYSMLQNNLFIEKLHDNIQDQMKNLFDLAEAEKAARQDRIETGKAERQEKIQNALGGLAILAIISALADLYGYIIPAVKRGEDWSIVLWIVVFLIVSLISYSILGTVIRESWKNRKEKKQMKTNQEDREQLL